MRLQNINRCHRTDNTSCGLDNHELDGDQRPIPSIPALGDEGRFQNRDAARLAMIERRVIVSIRIITGVPVGDLMT